MSLHVTSADCGACGNEYEIAVQWDWEDGRVLVTDIDRALLCGHCGASLPAPDEAALASEIAERERHQRAAEKSYAEDRAYDRMVEGG
jgi:hypothetical protein